jgi:HAD superfamily hydrolase (TIGR01509 family)
VTKTAIIFDFDGVIADSEALSNTVLAETVTRLGLPTTLEDALDRYQGRSWTEVVARIEAGVGEPQALRFADELKAETFSRLRANLVEVPGATAFIRSLAHLRTCIASSSSVERLAVCLETLGIASDFCGRIFSSEMVQRGKPHPDIFLHAAAQLGVEPSSCFVIEDSASGVRGGVAAGMTVVGLCAASHIREGHADRLAEAGATHVAGSWDEVSTFLMGQI